MRPKYDWTLLLLFCFLVPCLAFAQDQDFITGKVADARGTPIPGAGVSISSPSGKLAESLTDLDGSFRFEGLPAGTYRLEVEIVGFQKSVREGIDLSSDSSRSLDLRLDPVPPPALLPQQPAVAGSAVAGTEMRPAQQPAAPEAPVFQTAAVTDLPGLNQYQDELTLLAGSAGAAGEDNLLLITGNSANLYSGDFNDPGFRNQMMDAARMMGFQIQEFSPMGEGGPGGAPGMSFGGPGGGMGGGPGGGPGGFGGGPGGGVGFVGGRGRGAMFRQPVIEGNLSETYSNSALNARNYSLTGRTLDKPVQIQNNFGITVGGVLPFFKQAATSERGRGGAGPRRASGPPGWSFSYSGTRNRSALDILTTVPTDLERAGDFSQSFVQALVADPETGKPTVVVRPVELYLNPSDPSSRFTKLQSINPIAAGLLEFIPRANIGCADALCVNNYALQRSLPTTSDQVQFSISGLRLSSRDNIGVSYSRRWGKSLNAAVFEGLDTDRNNSAQNVNISGTHMFQSRLVGNWRVSFNRTNIDSSNSFAYKRDVEGEFGITGVSKDPMNWGPPTISFTNYGGISLAAPTMNSSQNLSLSGGLNRIATNHSIRSGGGVTWTQRNSRSDSNGRGSFSFTGYATILLDAEGRQVAWTGSDFADFLLGLPYSTSRRYVDPVANPNGNATYLRNRSWNLYVMDNWRLGGNLTINYGLRYEYTGPSYEKYDRLVTLDAAAGFSSLAQVFPDQVGPLSGVRFPRSIVAADRNNFAPRVGIAWRPKPRWPVVLRAGYGISYDTGGYSSIVNQLVNQPPFALTQNLASSRENPLTLENGFPVNPELTILNTYAIDPHYRASYIQQWNLDVQSQLSRVLVLALSYSGSKGTGLDVMRAPNAGGNAGKFIYQTNGGSAVYHGFSAQVTRRFSRGFNLGSSYTLSKSIDDVPNNVAQNDLNLAAERALSSQDQRHSFQTNFNYELPIGQNRRFFAGSSAKLLNFIAGWTFTGNLSLASGSPMTARYASSSGSGSGAALYNSLRPDATGAPVALPKDERTWLKFFNTAAFAIPSGIYGNAGRNTITGPGSFMVNLSVRKGFQLDESNRRLDLSCQVQNLLNHANPSGVSTTVNALNFGQVTSVRPMRSMTMNLRLRF